MPIFDYKCPKCGHENKDKLVKSSDKKVICECGADMVKIPSFPSFHLKGSGFYDTDYKGKDKKRAQGEAKEKAIPIKKSE